MSEEDSNLFKQATKGVKPLAYDGQKTDRIIKTARLKQQRGRECSQEHSAFAHLHTDRQSDVTHWSGDRLDFTPIEPEEELVFYRSGLPLKRLKALRAGHYTVEYDLDLHGLTLDQASDQLSSFLFQAKRQGARCVRIVHGKGGYIRGQQNSSAPKYPILKAAIHHWLPQDRSILAFCSAPPNQGGRGAVLVLLKRQQRSLGR